MWPLGSSSAHRRERDLGQADSDSYPCHRLAYLDRVAAFASDAAVVMERVCAGRSAKGHQGFLPYGVASPHADNLLEIAR